MLQYSVASDVVIHKINRMLREPMTRDDLEWLRRRMESGDETIRSAAVAAHEVKFPFLTDYHAVADSTLVRMEFFIRGELDNLLTGQREAHHARYFAPSNGELRKTRYRAGGGVIKQRKKIPSMVTRNFFRLFLGKLEEQFAEVAYRDAPPPARATERDAEAGEGLFWSLRLTYKNGQARAVAYRDAYVGEAELMLYALADFFADSADLIELQPGARWLGLEL